MLSELFLALLFESDFESQKTLSKVVFNSEDRKHLDFTNKQFNAKSTTMKRLNKIFETLVGDIEIDEIVDAIEYVKKIKKKSNNIL